MFFEQFMVILQGPALYAIKFIFLEHTKQLLIRVFGKPFLAIAQIGAKELLGASEQEKPFTRFEFIGHLMYFPEIYWVLLVFLLVLLELLELLA
jgi:hypothetical protein